MPRNKSSVSKKGSYVEIGEYWDSHDLSEVTKELKDENMELALESDVHYYAIDDSISRNLESVAKRRGVSAETLVNLWVREKVSKEATKQT